MENKQTAVEFLIEALGEYFPNDIGGIELVIKKAKEMEKQQIKDSYRIGYIKCDENKLMQAEQYYNKTYGSKGSVVAKRLKEEMPKHIADYVDAYAEQIANLEKSIIEDQLKNNK